MASKNQIKRFASLQKKKFRERERLFAVEGNRSVQELFACELSVMHILATEAWIQDNQGLSIAEAEVIPSSPDELAKISSLATAPEVIAIVQIPVLHGLPNAEKELVLVLDTVQDPGNMGTIIRIADWFGIKHIVCSNETADVFSPKVVQSTMGSMGRVGVHYTELASYITAQKAKGVPVYGTLLSGTDMYAQQLSESGLVILGNEGNGISEPIAELVDTALFIPSYPKGTDTVESLNVGTAAAIVCAEFRRRQ